MLKSKLIWALVLLALILLNSPVVLADQIIYGNLWVQYNITAGSVATPYYLNGFLDYDWLVNVPNIGPVYVNISGDTMTGDLNMGGNSLTNVGSLVLSGLTTGQDIIPSTHNLYSLGNSSHWWANAYITNLYSTTISATTIETGTLNATQLNSSEADLANLDSEVVDIETNLTIAGYEIKKDESDNLVVLLT